MELTHADRTLSEVAPGAGRPAAGASPPGALAASGLGKRYRRRWALSECTLTIPAGRVVGLVGPNGAGKTTLLHLAVGLLAPTSGTISVFGTRPAAGPHQLRRVGFVAQDAPVYRSLPVAAHLRMAAALNPGWDRDLASRRITGLGLDPRMRAGRLSGGQRAQLALTLAIAKRPDLLILDEPVAGLDPLARAEFLVSVHELAVERATTVVLSSHLVADLERICDYLILLVASRVRLAGEIDALLASHHRLSGPRADPARPIPHAEVIAAAHSGARTTLLVRADDPVPEPGWTRDPVRLDDLVVAYMSQAASARPTGATRSGMTR
jgi:ABC-2 type transport system ATP-binding protein